MNFSTGIFVFSVATMAAIASTSPSTVRNTDPAGMGNTTTNTVNRSNTTQNDAVNPGSSTFTDTTSVYPRRTAKQEVVQPKAAEQTPPDNQGNADTRNSRNDSDK